MGLMVIKIFNFVSTVPHKLETDVQELDYLRENLPELQSSEMAAQFAADLNQVADDDIYGGDIYGQEAKLVGPNPIDALGRGVIMGELMEEEIRDDALAYEEFPVEIPDV